MNEIKDMIKALVLAVATITAFICAINPQMFRYILSCIGF